MSQQRSFLLFLFVVLPLLAHTFPFSGFLSLSNSSQPNISLPESIPSYIELPILQDESGLYYVSVGWKNASDHSTSPSNSILPFEFTDNSTNPNSTGKMLLNLYSNVSFVSQCAGFLPYDCDTFECITSREPQSTTYLYQGMEVYGYKVSIGMESRAFSVCGYSVIYGVSCAPGFPHGFSGYLGLGHALNALFTVNKNFSIFLSDGKDGMNSALYAGTVDNGNRIDTTQSYFFDSGTDENWMIPFLSVRAIAQKGSRITNIPLPRPFKALFDLNTDVIGLPIELYLNITMVLNDYGVFCLEPKYKPICSLSRNYNSLPTFYLMVDAEGEKMLEIKPEVYLKPNEANSFYTLMFGALTEDKDTSSRLVVNTQYSDRVVLGKPFLTYYYVHFAVCENYGAPFVNIYVANHNSNKLSPFWLNCLIIGGAVLFVLVTIGGCIWVCVKFKKSKQGSKVWDMDQDVSKHEGESNDTSAFIDNILCKPFMGYSIRQENSMISSTTKRKDSSSYKRVERVWSNENIRNNTKTSDIHEAHTYGKQKFKGLYDDGPNSYEIDEE